MIPQSTLSGIPGNPGPPAFSAAATVPKSATEPVKSPSMEEMTARQWVTMRSTYVQTAQVSVSWTFLEVSGDELELCVYLKYVEIPPMQLNF